MGERIPNWITESNNPERWAARIYADTVDVDGCWVWTKGRDRKGYGRFSAHIDGVRRLFSAHRAAWLALRGPIPYPLVPDHLCRNRACCNPDHMELVTIRVNTQRAALVGTMGAPRRGCRVHGYEDGYLFRPAGTPYETWICRVCKRRRSAEYKQRRRVTRGISTKIRPALPG